MGYIIENASDDSIESLCQLFKNVFNQDITPEEWRWKYHDQALAGHHNVILRNETGSILGHAGSIILDGWISGAPAPVAQICDVMLAKEARGQATHAGPYAAFMGGLFQALQARIPDGLYYGFPGKRPFQLGHRLGFYRGTGTIYEWRLPITGPAKPIWPWWHLISMDWNDPRLDRLWAIGAKRTSGILVMNRRYLAWRYGRNPFHAYRLFGIRSGVRLVGWVVVSQKGHLLRCVDRLICDSYLHILLMLLSRYGYAMSCQELAWWDTNTPSGPKGAKTIDTGIIGTVVTASAPRFSSAIPTWQPGNADIY